MYLMTCTRPDLAYPLSILARYVAPGRHRPEHMAAAKRVLRYLCSTSGLGLVLGGRRPVVLTGHADASWADDQATQRSSQGYIFSLGSGSFSWRSTRSSSVLGSSCEAEIYAGAMAAQERRWLTYLLTDLGEQPRSPPVLYVDNKAMLALCREHRLEHRTKHIALRYFLARELQQRGQLRLAYVASQANTTDIFTKALPPGDHQRFCTMLATLLCLTGLTLLWHHRLGHPSLPRLRGMASRVLVSGLPRSLPPLPPGPAPTCVPCVEGRQRAAPHSSEFPPIEAPLQTLHMDVWGPARVRGQGHERYFLLVVDDYSHYTTFFPLRSKGEVTEVLIDWIRAARLRLRESFGSDFPVLRLHLDSGGEFSSARLGAFCRAQGIRQTFTLPASPQQNGIAERRIGMVMDVARTSMIHAAAPHFLWPFAVQYAAHQLNLQPRFSLTETSPTLLWTGKVGDASAFRVWGSRAFVRDLSTDKLSPRATPCVFLGFPPDAPGWQFYHPTSRRVLSSQDVTFDDSVPYYRLFPYRTAPLPPPPLFLAPGPPPVDPLPPQGPAPSGVSQVDAVEPVELAVDSGVLLGADSGGAAPGGAEPGGVEPGGAEPGVAEPGELVGCLMYLMTCTRPDLAYPLSFLARYVAPGRHRPEHMAAAKRVLRYLCSTSGMGLVLGGRRPVVLTGHADASWADDQATQRSSCEAEIYAGAMAAQELRWLTYLLTDLGEQPRSPPVLYVDNKAMLALCREHILEHRTKHIALRYFLARELQQRGQLRLAYVASKANTADIFTKALPPGDHQRFCTMLACFTLLDWSCDLLFSPTLPMGVGKICRKGETFVEKDVTCCYCFFGVDVENLPRVVISFDAQV
ncbi:unnamed protein product [Closterium sp. NIES-53]